MDHVQYVLHLLHVFTVRIKEIAMPAAIKSEISRDIASNGEKQNITLRLSKRTIQKARVLAAQQSTSISGLLTRRIEELAEGDGEFEQAMERIRTRLEKGFEMGELPKFDRDALHER
jgi:hypothetical protein